MRRRAAIAIAIALALLAETARAQTPDTPVTACATLDAARDASIGEKMTDTRLASGECLSIPRGTAFWVETWSGTTPCIRISDFDRCLWAADLAEHANW